MNKYTKSLYSLLLCLLLVYPGFVMGASDVSVHSGYTWSTDMEWGAWSFSNIEMVGSDSGIQLENLADGGYKTFGEATYKFSPGGTNNWVKSTINSENATQVATKYIWASINNKDSVSQINPDNGEIVKEWDVGDNPSRTSVGCDDDAWVANRGASGYYEGHLPSISHIIPGESRVITHLLPASLSQPRAISIKCANGGDELWVGANGYAVALDTQEFDELSDDALATEAQVGSTVSIAPGQPYSTYGSVFGDGSTFLYVATYSYIGNPPRTYKVNTLTHALDSTGFPVVKGRYVITNDWLGNVWRDGVCVRIDPDDGSTDELCTNGNKGIVILPAIATQGPKLAYFRRTDSSICVGDLLNNDTDTPTLENLSCTSDGSSGGVDNNGNAITGGGLGYDDDHDIWFIPRKGSYITELKQSEGYAIGHQYSITDKAGGQAYSYSDFIGNALDNSTSARIDAQYSSDGENYYSVGADGSIPSQVGPSADLYIKLKMYGSGTNSPLLKSFKIEYNSQDFANTRLIRTTHTSSLARNSNDRETTFERGEKIYVRIQMYEPERARNDSVLTDRFSNVDNPKNFRLKSNCTGQGEAVVPLSVEENQISFNIDISAGLSCLDYEYKAD